LLAVKSEKVVSLKLLLSLLDYVFVNPRDVAPINSLFLNETGGLYHFFFKKNQVTSYLFCYLNYLLLFCLPIYQNFQKNITLLQPKPSATHSHLPTPLHLPKPFKNFKQISYSNPTLSSLFSHFT
jgi:hypothetical protein